MTPLTHDDAHKNGGGDDPDAALRKAAADLGVDWRQYRDAKALLDYGVSIGREIDQAVIHALSLVERRIRAVANGADPAEVEATGAPPPRDASTNTNTSANAPLAADDSEADAPADRLTGDIFLEAYQSLAEAMTPITARSLKDSLPSCNGERSLAERWSRRLSFYTLGFLLIIFLTQIYRNGLLHLYPGGEEDDPWALFLYFMRVFLGTLEPFAYGGLGACVELLRTCHQYIANRSFNRARRAEYHSRLILGVIAGGTVMLLAETIIDDGETINLSSAALAFIAGFKVDFLYQAITRIADAILPKVGVRSVRRADQDDWFAPPRARAVDLAALAKQVDEAQTPEGRAAAQRLLDRLTKRPKGPDEPEH